MGFLDNAVNKSVPQGSSLAKPLLLAFGALLASGALTRRQAPTPAPTPGRAPTRRRPTRRLADCWEAWVDCSRSSSRAVMATWLNHGSGAGQISRSRRVNLARRSVRHLSRRWPKRRVCPNRT